MNEFVDHSGLLIATASATEVKMRRDQSTENIFVFTVLSDWMRNGKTEIIKKKIM